MGWSRARGACYGGGRSWALELEGGVLEPAPGMGGCDWLCMREAGACVRLGQQTEQWRCWVSSRLDTLVEH